MKDRGNHLRRVQRTIAFGLLKGVASGVGGLLVTWAVWWAQTR
ncbi:hypothetical protein [Streptomyces sp. NPDC056983]